MTNQKLPCRVICQEGQKYVGQNSKNTLLLDLLSLAFNPKRPCQ